MSRLERATKGKPTSLLGLVVSDEGKKFYNIDTRFLRRRRQTERRNRGPKRPRLNERRSSLNVEPTATSDVSVRRCQTAAPCREADSETNLFKNTFEAETD
jgi:hypothetical protein